MHPRALLIDAMGTLVSLDDPASALVAQLRDHFGVVLEPAQARAALRAEIGYYRDHLDEAVDDASLAALRARCSAILFDALPAVAALRGASAEAKIATLLGALRFTAYPDAGGALARARAAGARVVVVSNWDVSLPSVLARVGLGAAVDGVVTSAGAGAAKPDPAIFAAALALAGARPDECLHVGDSPAEDVAGARAAGVEPVLLCREDRRGPAAAGVHDRVRTIASLDELEWPSERRA